MFRPPEIAVVIPTLGRHRFVRDVLDDLSVQAVLPTEVVVVDQTPQTQATAPGFGVLTDRFPVRTLFLKERGTCVARNEGVRLTKAPFILFLDDDVRFDRHLIASHLAVLEETGVDAVHGGVAGPDGRLREEASYNPAWDPAWALISSPNSMSRRMCIGVAGGNLLIRREWFDRIGGFDEWFNDGNGDDFDLGLRLFKAGAIVLYDPKPVVTHLRVPSGGRRYQELSRVKNLFRPEPPPTTPYFYMKHFPGRGPQTLFLNHLISIYTRGNANHFWVFLLGPLRLLRSWRRAREMVRQGPRLSI